MPKVSDLPNSALIMPVVTAFKAYLDEAKKDPVLKHSGMPLAQVYVELKLGGTIILLPEAHDSTNRELQKAAAGVAAAVLKIPKVRVAVEMPHKIKGNYLISDVGWTHTPDASVAGTGLFDHETTARGSIAHNIAFMDAKKPGSSVRCPGEDNPRATPGNSMAIQRSMVNHLLANASAQGQICVYPVGMNHMTTAMYSQSLGQLLAAAHWTLHDNT
jgi:hypothetical protein